jgi:hypothetical protein
MNRRKRPLGVRNLTPLADARVRRAFAGPDQAAPSTSEVSVAAE